MFTEISASESKKEEAGSGPRNTVHTQESINEQRMMACCCLRSGIAAPSVLSHWLQTLPERVRLPGKLLYRAGAESDRAGVSAARQQACPGRRIQMTHLHCCRTHPTHSPPCFWSGCSSQPASLTSADWDSPQRFTSLTPEKETGKTAGFRNAIFL